MDIARMEGVEDGSGRVLFYRRTKRGRKEAKIELLLSTEAGEPDQNVHEIVDNAQEEFKPSP